MLVLVLVSPRERGRCTRVRREWKEDQGVQLEEFVFQKGHIGSKQAALCRGETTLCVDLVAEMLYPISILGHL